MSNATGGNAVLAFRRAATGELIPAGSFPTGGIGTGDSLELGNSGGLVLSQDQHWLYVVNAGSNDITVFAVDDDDLLHRVSKTASGGNHPVSIAVDDDLVYILNANSDSITGFRATEGGRLKPIFGSTRGLGATGTSPAQISFSPDGNSLVITEKATNKLAVFGVSRAGLADSAPKIEPSAGLIPWGFSFTKRRTLLVTEAASFTANTSSVSSYHLGRDGRLALVEGTVPTKQIAACWIAVTPDGRYAYTSNTFSQSITGFRVTPSGDLTLLDADGKTASTGANNDPLDIVISGDGEFLYTLNNRGDTISAFRIGRGGELAPIATLPGLPASANGLAIR